MAGNLTGLHVFANDVSPEPLSLLDTNYSALNSAFNALANFANYYVDSGAANTMVITVTPAQTVAYSDGLLLEVLVAANNTGAATLNVNGLGPRPVVDGQGNALTAGALLAGIVVQVIFRATANNFQILGGGGSAAAPTFNATVTINAVSGRQSLIVNGATNAALVTLNAGALASSFIIYQVAGVTKGYIGTDGGGITSSGTGSGFGIRSEGPLLLLANGGASAITYNASGQFIVPQPTAGPTMVLNGPPGANQVTLQLSTPAGAECLTQFVVGGSTFAYSGCIGTAGDLITGSQVGDWAVRTVNTNILLNTNNGALPAMKIASNGVITINAPTTSAQAALTINAATGAPGLTVIGNGGGGVGITATGDDTGGFGYNNAASTRVLTLTTVKGWTGGGADVTDAAIGGRALVNLYAQNSSNPTLQLAATSISGWSVGSSALVDMTPDIGSFIGTLTGVTGAPTNTNVWSRHGKNVTVWLGAVTGTSNANTFTITGVPAAIVPASASGYLPISPAAVENNGAVGTANVSVATPSAGTLTFFINATSAGWTSSGIKGLANAAVISYYLG